ncbi:MAG TPA: type II toxin-antitoxin system PemK/MazF family toxin [Candidatus Kapabacteria bacterium]|nr:type II toxin-antitoxin system PemK/MazF family toxin [Candidatus Kapabacteria bacterium]
MAYKPGDVAIAPFTNTDLREGKNRPVLLLSRLPNYESDWLGCMITSQLHHFTEGVDVTISDSDSDFHATSLKTSSLIRVTRLMVIAEDQMTGSIGVVSKERYARVISNLVRWLSQKRT